MFSTKRRDNIILRQLIKSYKNVT